MLLRILSAAHHNFLSKPRFAPVEPGSFVWLGAGGFFFRLVRPD